jgi:transcriptional regulator with XRE-family HTH domain
VEDEADPTNAAVLPLRFVPKALPSPFVKHIDGKKLKAFRVKQNLTQKQVGEAVKSYLGGSNPQGAISRLEAERWKNAPDELLVRVAEVLKQPLSAFRKDG